MSKSKYRPRYRVLRRTRTDILPDPRGGGGGGPVKGQTPAGFVPGTRPHPHNSPPPPPGGGGGGGHVKRHTRDEFVPGTREFRDRIRQELARGYSRQPDPPHCPGRSKLMAMRRCDEEAWECGRTALVGRMVE